jgi:hypothetical protein
MDNRFGNIIEYTAGGSLSAKSAFIYPVWLSDDIHPVVGDLSFLYIYDIETNKEYVLNLNHMDSEKITFDDVELNIDTAFIYDMKSFLNTNHKFDNMYDADMVKYLQKNDKLSDEFTSAHTFFHRKFIGLQLVNNYIPIVKHIESIRECLRDFLNYYDSCDLDLVKTYSKFYIKSLYGIELNGIMTESGVEYTHYNPYTLTSRPSNTFNGTNYAALNKDDNTRSRFISRFDGGELIQFDYDAYHVRIIGEMIGFPIPMDQSAHKLLQSYYGDVSYSKSKGITFRQLYGGVEDEYAHIPFFQRIENFKEILWEDFLEDGYIETELGRKIRVEHYTDFSKNKLFNYLLQATETEKNLQKVFEINKELEGFKSKLVLYTYDSYLFDMSADETDLISKLKILIDGGNFPSKIEVGENYSEMESFKLQD